MGWLQYLGRGARTLWRHGRLERDLEEELRIHLEMQAEENHRRGMSDQEARRAAPRPGAALLRPLSDRGRAFAP